MDVLIENVTLLSPDQEEVLEGQNVVVEGQRIARVTAAPVTPGPATKRINGRDRLLIPGLINAHTHSPENFLKGRVEAMPLELWLADLFGSSFAFSEREIYLAAMVGSIEMLKTGTTAVVDHFWVNGAMSEPALDAVMSAYRDAGIRAAVAPLVEDDHRVVRLILEQNPELEGKVAISAASPTQAEEYLRVLEGFFQHWHRAEGGRLLCMAGPSGAQWCSDRLMTGAMEIARRYDGGYHMHAEETRFQAVSCRQLFGHSALAHLNALGLLGERTSLAHCVWVDDHDMDLLAASGTTVCHNPVCNLKLGSGFAPVIEMRERGVHVALACDGAASNDNQVMFDVLKVAGLMHTVRDPRHQRWLKARQVLRMATEEGARVLGLAGSLGTIRPGALADLVLLDMTTPAFTPLNDPAQHLVYAETGSSVRTVLVDGRVVVEEGRLVGVDETALLAEARQVWAQRRRDIPALSPQAQAFLAAQERFRQRLLTTPLPFERLA